MLDGLKRLWPFVGKRYHAAERRRWRASEDAQYQWYTEARNQMADRLAGVEAERDAADWNAFRGWKAADDLAGRLKDADADRVKAIEVGERLGKIAEEAIAERDAAREQAAEADRRARRHADQVIRYAIQISKARLALK